MKEYLSDIAVDISNEPPSPCKTDSESSESGSEDERVTAVSAARKLKVLDDSKLDKSDPMVVRLEETVEASQNPKEAVKLSKYLPLIRRASFRQILEQRTTRCSRTISMH